MVRNTVLGCLDLQLWQSIPTVTMTVLWLGDSMLSSWARNTYGWICWGQMLSWCWTNSVKALKARKLLICILLSQKMNHKANYTYNSFSVSFCRVNTKAVYKSPVKNRSCCNSLLFLNETTNANTFSQILLTLGLLTEGLPWNCMSAYDILSGP